MFKIFVAEPILKTIIEDESKKAEASRSFLYKVLKERKTLYVAAATPDKSWADTLKSQHKIIVDYSLSDYINKIKDHPETVLENPSSIFILDIPITEAEKIQTSFGVVCMSGKNLTTRFLIDTNDEHTIDEQEAFGNGWETVLKSVKGIPSNALLLTDRYLNGIPQDSRMSKGKFLTEDMLTPELLAKLRHYNEVAQNRGETLAEMALAWILHQKGVTSVLVGASSTAQLEKNLRCVNALAFDTNDF